MTQDKSFTCSFPLGCQTIETEAWIIVEGVKRYYRAVWDTGATNTHISNRVKEDFDLDTLGFDIAQSVSGNCCGTFHLVDLRLPEDIEFSDLKVFCSDIGDINIDILIGMDVIAQGEFHLKRDEERISFTFSC